MAVIGTSSDYFISLTIEKRKTMKIPSKKWGYLVPFFSCLLRLWTLPLVFLGMAVAVASQAFSLGFLAVGSITNPWEFRWARKIRDLHTKDIQNQKAHSGHMSSEQPLSVNLLPDDLDDYYEYDDHEDDLD